MIIKKEQFIKNFSRMVEKKLNEFLPEEDFEGSMMENSFDMIYAWIGRMKGHIRRDE